MENENRKNRFKNRGLLRCIQHDNYTARGKSIHYDLKLSLNCLNISSLLIKKADEIHSVLSGKKR